MSAEPEPERSEFPFTCDVHYDQPDTRCLRTLTVWATGWSDARRQAFACHWHCYVGGQARCPEHSPTRTSEQR